MTREQLKKSLKHIRSGCAYNIRGEAIEWLDKNQPEPTPEELEAGRIAVELLAYKEQRAKAYPSMGDQLDALWKIVNGTPDAQSDATKAKIAAVKQQYPKPEGL